MDKQPYIRIENVTKKYGSFTAIQDLTLDIYKGEFFSILGPSGCGKTSLLRMLAGFEEITHGRILLDNEDISHIPAHKRPINMMFQSYALFPHMTVEKNIAFGLQQENTPKEEIATRVAEMLQLVQLTEMKNRKPKQLSGGQQQRVALARSLIKRPKLLLLDEPLAALDKRLRDHTQFELMNIQEKLGITFIIVTHDQGEAMTVSSRIAMMHEGKLAQIGSPNELYETPKSCTVANFIGDINLLSGTYQGEDEIGTKMLCDVSNTILYSEQHVQAEIGQKIWFAIRREKVEIKQKKPKTDINVLKGIVEDIGYGGSISTYHVLMQSKQLITAMRANKERSIANQITWNDEVFLYWAPSAAIVLLS